jgi:hypothetical protein
MPNSKSILEVGDRVDVKGVRSNVNARWRASGVVTEVHAVSPTLTWYTVRAGVDGYGEIDLIQKRRADLVQRDN